MSGGHRRHVYPSVYVLTRHSISLGGGAPVVCIGPGQFSLFMLSSTRWKLLAYFLNAGHIQRLLNTPVLHMISSVMASLWSLYIPTWFSVACGVLPQTQTANDMRNGPVTKQSGTENGKTLLLDPPLPSLATCKIPGFNPSFPLHHSFSPFSHSFASGIIYLLRIVGPLYAENDRITIKITVWPKLDIGHAIRGSEGRRIPL